MSVPLLLVATVALLAAPGAARERDRFAPQGPPVEWTRSAHGPDGGYKLALRRWAVAGPKALLIFQHGGGFHSGYFDRVGTALAAAGYEALAIDAIGHSHSQGPGGLTYYEDVAHPADDLRRLVVTEKARRPQLPVVVMGESMGALFTAPLAIERHPGVAAHVLSGALLRMAPATAPPWLVVQALRLLGTLLPAMRVTLPSLNATFDSAFGDPRWAAAARADPRVAVDSFYMGAAAQNFPKMQEILASAPQVVCPLLVMHSLVDTRTDVEGAREFYEGAASADKQLLLYDDASHQLFQDSEANTERAIGDLIAWLQRHFGAGAGGTPTPTGSMARGGGRATAVGQGQEREEEGQGTAQGPQDEL